MILAQILTILLVYCGCLHGQTQKEKGEIPLMDPTVICSSGAFSHYPDFTDHRLILQYGPQLDVEGLEVLFYPGWYTILDQIAADLCASGLRFPVLHTEKNIGVALGSTDRAQRELAVHWLEENCRLGHLIGSGIIVLHLWGWPELDDNLANNLEMLSNCLDKAERYDTQIAIETIPSRARDPLSNIQLAVADDPRSQVALDTEFLARHQQIEEVFAADWLWEEQRVRHVHIKDFDGESSRGGKRRYLHPGEGDIDFTGFFTRLRQHGFAGTVSLEASVINGEGQVDIGKLQTSLNFIKQNLAQS
jgi:sugar phosphate isomerase/epimerase